MAAGGTVAAATTGLTVAGVSGLSATGVVAKILTAAAVAVGVTHVGGSVSAPRPIPRSATEAAGPSSAVLSQPSPFNGAPSVGPKSTSVPSSLSSTANFGASAPPDPGNAGAGQPATTGSGSSSTTSGSSGSATTGPTGGSSHDDHPVHRHRVRRGLDLDALPGRHDDPDLWLRGYDDVDPVLRGWHDSHALRRSEPLDDADVDSFVHDRSGDTGHLVPRHRRHADGEHSDRRHAGWRGDHDRGGPDDDLID